MNFDFNIIMDLLIPHITIFCLVVGYVLKKWMPLDNKFIPTILVILGALAGGILNGWDFIAITAGMISALASVGLHQAFYQYMKIDSTALVEVDSMGPDLGEDEEKIEEDKEEKEE